MRRTVKLKLPAVHVQLEAEMSEDWLAVAIGLGLVALVGTGLIAHVPW
ncbi:MAG: hypothetical protein AB1555_11660 [Nitrospirota bacterium]